MTNNLRMASSALHSINIAAEICDTFCGPINKKKKTPIEMRIKANRAKAKIAKKSKKENRKK